MDPTPLANAELAVMERLWDDSPQTARALREALYPGKGQHGTIQRLLQRLEEKGELVRAWLSRGAVHLRPCLEERLRLEAADG